MPERLASGSVEGYEVIRGVRGEDYVARSAQHPGTRPAWALPLVAPLGLAGLVIDRLQHALAPTAAIVAAPALGFVLIVVDVIDAISVGSIYVKEAGGRAEAWRRPIGGAGLIGSHQRAVVLGKLGGVWNGLALGVETLCPIRFGESGRHDLLSRGAIQDKEVAVARGLGDQLARLAVDGSVYQNRRLIGVPIVRVVGRRLEIPLHLAGVWIDRHDGFGE